MSLALPLPRDMHLCRSSSKAARLPTFLKLLQHPCVLLTFGRMHNPLRLHHKKTLQRPKVARTWCALRILTSKCASRHNGVHFFDSSTSKSALAMVFFVYFDLDMCFTPQQRALFQHLIFQTCSEPGVLCTFLLRHVLRVTAACNFPSLI